MWGGIGHDESESGETSPVRGEPIRKNVEEPIFWAIDQGVGVSKSPAPGI
jgi:hypothetical protein